MWPLSYAKRLTSDLETWVTNGWVSEDNANLIRASLDRDETASRLPIVITILGAVLIGFAAMAFVAANWADMSKGLRLALLGIAMWSAYGTAALLHLQKHESFAEAALLIGVGLFGASIMLIGQMYHLPSDFSAGLLIWSLGALVTAWAVNSRAALIAAQLLIMGWTSNTLMDGALHLPYLLPWAALTVLAIRLDWTPAKHMAVISMLFWLLGNVPSLGDRLGWGPIEVLTVLSPTFVALMLAGMFSEQMGRPFGRAMQAYGALTLLVSFWLGHVIDEGLKGGSTLIMPLLSIGFVAVASYITSQRIKEIAITDIAAFTAFPAGILFAGALVQPESGVALWFTAPVFLLLSIWVVALGTRLHNSFLINLGFAAFGAEALYLYLETFGSLLDTAAFFAIGGVLLIAGGFVWERLRRRATAAQSSSQSPSQGEASS